MVHGPESQPPPRPAPGTPGTPLACLRQFDLGSCVGRPRELRRLLRRVGPFIRTPRAGSRYRRLLELAPAWWRWRLRNEKHIHMGVVAEKGATIVIHLGVLHVLHPVCL